MTERRRTDYDMDRLKRVIAFCEGEPRSMAQIRKAFGNAPQIRFAVHNAVKRGLLENVRPDEPCGLYAAKVRAADIVRKNAAKQKAPRRPKRAPIARPAQPRDDGAAALVAAWGGAAR